ncbi:hypothetical protein [Paenibacillus sp. sgz500958]|uniref:hypothetical protein n=1 Tax=Paenibacillus sp. sgz500958 TaxID=3242475 RepID=UPI0036D31409
MFTLRRTNRLGPAGLDEESGMQLLVAGKRNSRTHPTSDIRQTLGICETLSTIAQVYKFKGEQ